MMVQYAHVRAPDIIYRRKIVRSIQVANIIDVSSKSNRDRLCRFRFARQLIPR